jgi:hypothetical protein
MHKTPANIKANIATPAKNLFFISNLPPSPRTSAAKPKSRAAWILHYNEKQLPCQSTALIQLRTFVFSIE